jgi:hypothetical protein
VRGRGQRRRSRWARHGRAAPPPLRHRRRRARSRTSRRARCLDFLRIATSLALRWLRRRPAGRRFGRRLRRCFSRFGLRVLVTLRRARRMAARRHDLRCAHDPPRNARSEPRIGFEVVVHFVEGFVERGQHVRRKNCVDLLIGRRRFHRRDERAWADVLDRALLRSLQKPFDLRRECRKRKPWRTRGGCAVRRLEGIVGAGQDARRVGPRLLRKR